MSRGSYRIRALRRQLGTAEEHAQARQDSLEMEREQVLLERRAKEDPLGFDRCLYAHEHTQTVIDEAQEELGWRLFNSYHRGDPMPERVQAAMEEEWKIRMEWLYGDSVSESAAPQPPPPEQFDEFAYPHK